MSDRFVELCEKANKLNAVNPYYEAGLKEGRRLGAKEELENVSNAANICGVDAEDIIFELKVYCRNRLKELE